MTSLWHDLRFALRNFRKQPGFTAIACITLALAIGANTAIFSLVDALFLQPLPVTNANELVSIYQTENGRGFGDFSYPDYVYYREHSREVFTDLAAQYATAPIYLSTAQGSRQINASVVSQNYFPLLELRPALGRFFLPDEDEVPGRNPVAVIGEALWRGMFGGDAQILGKTIRLNSTEFTIVGVAPENFKGAAPLAEPTSVWIPAAMFRVGYRYCDVAERDCRIVTLVGRLAKGRSAVDEQAALTVLARQLEIAFPTTNRGIGAAVYPARGVPGRKSRQCELRRCC